MIFSLFPLLAAVLPTLLQHATPANAAALCVPGLYCPQAPSLHSPPEPRCSSSVGGGSSSPSGTVHHTSSSSSQVYTTTITIVSISTPSTTHTHPSTVTEPPYTTTTYTTPTGGVPSGKSSSGGQTATTTVTVTGGPAPTGTSCSTGPVQCCNSVEPASSKNAAGLMGLLGIVLQGVDVPVGLTCNPISVIGAGSGGTCNAQTVCCENNNFNGLINIGCTPINLGL